MSNVRQAAEGIADLLEKAKARIVRLSSQVAHSGEDWDAAQRLLKWARTVDEIHRGLTALANSEFPSDAGLPPTSVPPDGAELPRFYLDGKKLVKEAPSRDGTTYKHRVTKENYEHIVAVLADFAAEGREFRSRTLQDRCGVPRHEPGIVLNVLEERGLLARVGRGRYAFIDRSDVVDQGAAVWQQLPGG